MVLLQLQISDVEYEWIIENKNDLIKDIKKSLVDKTDNRWRFLSDIDNKELVSLLTKIVNDSISEDKKPYNTASILSSCYLKGVRAQDMDVLTRLYGLSGVNK